MQIEVLNSNGQKTGSKVNLDDAVFAIEPNDHAIYLDVKRYLAAQRSGTHKTSIVVRFMVQLVSYTVKRVPVDQERVVSKTHCSVKEVASSVLNLVTMKSR